MAVELLRFDNGFLSKNGLGMKEGDLDIGTALQDMAEMIHGQQGVRGAVNRDEKLAGIDRAVYQPDRHIPGFFKHHLRDAAYEHLVAA
jgi:hypothetical protein